MESRIIIPTAEGSRLTYPLRLHDGHEQPEVRIVFDTSEEVFERWLFYLLRDVGAHIVTDEPKRLREVLGLAESDPGILSEVETEDVNVTRHFERT